MSNIYKNITGNVAEILVSMKDQVLEIPHISVANIHATDSVAVSLYVSKTDSADAEERALVGQGGNWDPLATTVYTYVIIQKLTLPVNSSVVLEQPELSYNNTKYDLYIKLNASDSAVDVIIGKPIENGSSTSSTMSTGSTSSSY